MEQLDAGWVGAPFYSLVVGMGSWISEVPRERYCSLAQPRSAPRMAEIVPSIVVHRVHLDVGLRKSHGKGR